jgi:hypothetical protein
MLIQKMQACGVGRSSGILPLPPHPGTFNDIGNVLDTPRTLKLQADLGSEVPLRLMKPVRAHLRVGREVTPCIERRVWKAGCSASVSLVIPSTYCAP